MLRVYKLKRDEKGQSMVEFALILPILLLLVLGIIQFGIIFSSQIAVTNAAREGARVAAVGESDTVILNRIRSSLGNHIFLDPISTLNISVTPNPRTDAHIGNEVTVRVHSITLDLFVPVPGIFVENGEVILSGQASMRLESLPDPGGTPGGGEPPEEEEPSEEEDPTPEYADWIDGREPSYSEGDIVKYGEKYYRSTSPDNTKKPTNGSFWDEFNVD